MAATVRIQLEAGQASPGKVGQALGAHGVNVGAAIAAYNAATAAQRGIVVPVLVTVYEDRSFDLELRTPPTSALLARAAGLPKGAARPGSDGPVAKLERGRLRRSRRRQRAGPARGLGELAEAAHRRAVAAGGGAAVPRPPHAGEEAPLPKWMGAIDRFTPPAALGGGAALAGANPKNLLLAVSGAAAIAQTGISGSQQGIAYAVFAVVGTVGVAAPVVIYFAMGKRSAALLERLKDWMGHNNAFIMAVLCLVIGVKLLGDALAGLTS